MSHRLAALLAMLIAAVGAAPSAALATSAQAAVRAASTPVDVTANPVVRRDLALAEQFWLLERPDLAPPCGRASVVLARQLDAAVGNDGTSVGASAVWAETRLGNCQITIGRAAWKEIRHAPAVGGKYGVCTVVWRGSTGICTTNGWSQYDVCVRIAHEYAHILGLADTAEGPAILNQQAAGGDPICSRTFFPHRLGHAAKRWLRSHGYSGSG
jgi:hypothetical protein